MRFVQMDPLAYRFDEAARITGVSSDTLRRFVHRGELKAFKLGKATVIAADELKRFLDERAESHGVH